MQWLDQLRQLGAQATGGPWEVNRKDGDVAVTGPTGVDVPWLAYLADEGDQYIEDAISDAAFIVAARNLWEPLLAVAEAATGGGALCKLCGWQAGRHAPECALSFLGRAVEAAGKERE